MQRRRERTLADELAELATAAPEQGKGTRELRFVSDAFKLREKLLERRRTWANERMRGASVFDGRRQRSAPHVAHRQCFFFPQSLFSLSSTLFSRNLNVTEYDFDADLDLGARDGGATGGAGLDASDGEDGDFGAAATAAAAEANGGARAGGRSRRPSLRAAPDLGKEYAGKSVSIAEAFGGEGGNEEGGRAPFREEAEEEEDEGSDDEGDDDEGGEGGKEPERSFLPPATNGENAELAALDAEYAAADAAALDSREALREAAARDARKGAAVAAQRAAWDRALEARIMLQRALGGCNRLPRPETMALVVARLGAGGEGAGEGAAAGEAEEGRRGSDGAAAVSELGVAAAGVAREAAALAVKLAEAADVLAARAAGREAGRRGKKRKQQEGAESGGDDDGDDDEEEEEEEDDDDLDDDDGGSGLNPETAALWRRLERSLRSFEPVRDAAFDRWHRKAALLAGGGAALRGGLRVLDQPPSKQVAAAMASSFGSSKTGGSSFSSGGGGGGAENRLLSRSRLLRSDAPKRLGETSALAAAAAAASGEKRKKKKLRPSASASSASDSDSGSSSSDDDEEEEGGQQQDFPASDARDRDTYDDGEFYSQLLKEFVEANSSATGGGGAAGLGLGAARSGRSHVKRRKVVDRRASKGRKLRFDVQEKLVGFMAPVEEGEEPALARQLVGCLFGVVRSSRKGSRRASG